MTDEPTSGVEAVRGWDDLTPIQQAIVSAWNYMQSPNSYSKNEKDFVFELLDAAHKDVYSHAALATPPASPASGVEAVPGLRECAEELADLMEAVVAGDYKPDSFTTQPIRAALATPAASPSPVPAAEPIAVLRFDRAKPGNENEMPKVVSCDWLPDGEYRVYLAPPSPAPAAVEELVARVYRRDSTSEWVLEIQGTINDRFFICRHTEPLTTPIEEVAGLPTTYTTLSALAADKERIVGERDAALGDVIHMTRAFSACSDQRKAAEAHAAKIQLELDKTRYALLSLIWLPAVRAAIDALPPGEELRKMTDQPTIHDLVVAFENAERQATAQDNLSADPSQWGTIRGIKAVRDLIIGNKTLD